MDDGHMFDYDHCHRSVFIERKCNFRLALMYYKTFLFPLGAWIAPDGNNAADLEILCKKGHSMSHNIAASHLQRHEVMLA